MKNCNQFDYLYDGSAPWGFFDSVDQIPITRVRDKFGSVYCIEYEGLTKIGKSQCARTRVQGIAALLPRHVSKIACSLVHHTPSKTEKIFHQYYRKRRTKGEWFAITIDQIDFVQLSIVGGLVPSNYYAQNNSIWLKHGREYRRLPSLSHQAGVRV